MNSDKEKIKIKVCGMTSKENIKKVLDIGVDMIGLIFVPTSKRFLKDKKAIIDFVSQIVQVKKVVVIFIPYLIYYLKKYRELKRFFSYNENMKHSLQLLIQQLEKYLSIYFWGSLLLTPVSGFLLCFVILYEMKALGFLLYFDVYSSATLSMILSFALLPAFRKSY